MNTILESSGITKRKEKEYRKLIDLINDGSDTNKCLSNMQTILKISNDFKRDNALSDLGKTTDFDSSDGIDWSSVSVELNALYEELEDINGKRIIRQGVSPCINLDK